MVDFAILGDHRIKLQESEKWDKYIDLAREPKETMKHKGDSATNCNWCTWTLIKEVEEMEMRGQE